MPAFSPKGYPIRDKRKLVSKSITARVLLTIHLCYWHNLALMSTTKATILAPRLSISLLLGSRVQATSRAVGTLSLTPTTSRICWIFTNAMDLTFSSLEQEMEYRNWNVEKDGPLETRLMFRDLILLKRPSIRNWFCHAKQSRKHNALHPERPPRQPAGIYFVSVTDAEWRKCVKKVVKE